MPCGALLAAVAVTVTAAVRLPSIILPAQSDSVTIPINLSAHRDQLLAAAADQTRDIILDLDGIEAERPPDVYFQIFVHTEAQSRGRSVGNLTLYGAGIRNEARGAFRPAQVQLVITPELRLALRQSSTIQLTFVAQGAGGTTTAARSSSTVTIHNPSIGIAPHTRG